MKYISALVTTLVLTACGGGGGASSGSNGPALAGLAYSNVGAVLVPGKFGPDQSQYVISSSIRYLGNGQTEPGPVKVFKLASTGLLTDQTVEILGGAVSAFTNVPIVTDFNHDGIDDIFLPGFTDTQDLVGSIAFISRSGQSHIKVTLPDPVWAHGAAAVDINNDGHTDVIGSQGHAWINDGQGNFNFRAHSYNDVPGLWMHGSGVCAGDFNNTGRPQLVFTDLNNDGNKAPIADTVIFEIDHQGLPTVQHTLPVPILDRVTATETSHDVACKVADLNNDGLLDIVVLSRPWASTGQSWSNQGQAQILINRGNWQFDDVTDTALAGFNTNVLISYAPLVLDLNGDGKLDLWFGYFDYDTGQANQVFLNNGSGIFTKVASDMVNGFVASGGMIPVAVNNRWALVYAKMNTSNKTTTFYVTESIYNF